MDFAVEGEEIEKPSKSKLDNKKAKGSAILCYSAEGKSWYKANTG